MRILCLEYHNGRNCRHHLQVFDRYRAKIMKCSPSSLHFAAATTVADAVRTAAEAGPDVLFLCPEWTSDAADVESLLSGIRGVSHCRIALVDVCDGSNTPFLGLLPHVDLLIKSHCLRNPLDYQREFTGGYIVPSFLATHMGWDIGQWHFGSTVDLSQMHKIRHGWTWAVKSYYEKLSFISALVPIPWRMRRVDINTRFGGSQGGDSDWYLRYRRYSMDKVRELASDYRLSGHSRVGRRRYLLELKLSKLAFAPFGWGEVCYRDFEAIACGALLVKPDMAHLQVHPDIYMPFETYVPVQWDLSDLAEKCQHYLRSPAEASRIANKAQGALQRFYREKQFLGLLQSYLESLGYRQEWQET